jgi:hypothetical protein
VLNSPDLELAGVLVYSDHKDGVDAGSLVGLPDSGIKATTNRDAILALDADVVVYAPRLHPDTRVMDEDVLALLRSGKNVVTPSGYWYPPLYGAEYTDRIDAACREGNSSLFGAGENPGYFLPQLAVTLTSLVTEISSIGLTEMCDLTHSSPELVFGYVGFGQTPAELEGNSVIANMVDRCFHEELNLVAYLLGASIDRIERTSRLATIEHDIQIDAGPLKAGTVVAQAHRWSGIRDDREILSVTTTWFVHRDVPGWDLDDDRWTIHVEGRPSLTVDIKPVTSFAEGALTKYADIDAGVMETITAMVVCNAIPRVCDAKPGLVLPAVRDQLKLNWVNGIGVSPVNESIKL